MKKRQLDEFKTKSAQELSAEIARLQAKKLEVQRALLSGKEKNLRALKNIRRDIAQILSIIRTRKGDSK